MNNNLTTYHQHLQRAKNKFTSKNTFLLNHIIDEIIMRIAISQKKYAKIASLFALTDYLPQQLKQQNPQATITKIEHPIWLENFLGEQPDKIIDNENLQLENEYYDLIATPYLYNLENLQQIYNGLCTNGTFIAAVFGSKTLQELKQAIITAESEITGGASSHGFDFFNLEQLGNLLQQAQFKQIIIDKTLLTIKYASVENLIDDLRSMAATNKNIDKNHLLNKKIYKRMIEIYSGGSKATSHQNNSGGSKATSHQNNSGGSKATSHQDNSGGSFTPSHQNSGGSEATSHQNNSKENKIHASFEILFFSANKL